MSEKVTQLIEDVKALTVLELSELVKALEEEFGVSYGDVSHYEQLCLQEPCLSGANASCEQDDGALVADYVIWRITWMPLGGNMCTVRAFWYSPNKQRVR